MMFGNRTSRARRHAKQDRQRHRQRLGRQLGRLVSRSPRIEALEDRRLLTTTVYLDFGNGFPVNGMSMTAMQLRDSINGPNLMTQVFGGGTPIPLAETITMNQDVPLNVQADILPIVQRAFEPYDVNVVLSSVSSVADVQALFALNAGDPDGEFDAWIPVVDIRSAVTDAPGCNLSVACIIGGSFGLGGLSPTVDIGAGVNARDDSPLIFSDQLASNANSLAWGILHEVGHTFSLQHLDAGNNTGPNATQLTSSELIKQFGFQQYEGLFGRFDYPLGNANVNPAVTRDPYTLLVSDPDIGLRDDNANGIPDLEYSTGTGANDQIDLVPAGLDQASVTVQPFSDTARTNAIGTANNYNILSMESLLVNAGQGDDQINLDIGSAPAFRIVGGGGIDELNIDAAGGNVTIGADGSIFLSGKLLEVTEVENINLLNVGVLTADGTAGDDEIFVQRILGGDNIQVTINGVTIFTGTVQQRIDVDGFAGNDLLTVDSSNGLLDLPEGIRFDGDGGFDSLELQQTGGSQTSETVSVGQTPGDGQSIIVGPGGTQLVQFENLEPISTNVVVADFNIASVAGLASLLQDDNQINYSTALINPPSWGRVTIDNFEPIEFVNKANLNIDAGAGSDEISLNNPNVPTGLTSINIDGGDPTAGSDTVIISGTAGLNAIDYAPTPDGDAVVTISGQVPIDLTGVENAVIDGQGGSDELTYTSPAGRDDLIHRPGLTPDSGSIDGYSLFNQATLMPLSYTGLGGLGSLTLADLSGVRADTAEIRGTNQDDLFDINAAGDLLVTDSDNNRLTVLISTPGVDALILQGLAGDDRFSVLGDNPFDGGLVGPGIYIEGGSPDSGSDVLNFTGGGGFVTVDLEAQRVTETPFAPVNFTGIETLNIDANADLGILTTAGNDSTIVTPTGPAAGTLQNNDASPWVNFENVANFFVDQTGGDDTLQVNYTTGADDITVDALGGVISDGVNVTLNFVAGNTESVRVDGKEGDDTFTVTPDFDIPVFIDGGDPIGTTAGDTIVVNGAAIFEQGPENDEGSFLSIGNERVSFDNIESAVVVAPPGPAKAFIQGDGADNNITIIARDASTNVGADGIRDFTSTIDDGIEILWLNYDQLVIDARSGDDDIVIRVPAPNNADWDVDAWIFGGAPAAGPGDDGDRLVIETPQTNGPDAILYTPTAADSGILVIDEDGNGAFNGTDTIIQIGNVPLMPPMPGFPNPDPGGVEFLVYDGGGGDDTIEILGDGTANVDDRFESVPGDAHDEGFLGAAADGETLLGIRYENLGFAGSITVDGLTGSNTLVALGRDATDTLTIGFVGVDAAYIELTTGNVSQVDLLTTNVQDYIFETLDGDDDINLVAPILARSLVVRGGSPSAGSDTLNVNTAIDVADNDAVIMPDAVSPDDQVVDGLGAQINVTGVELINVIGAQAQGDSLTVQLGDGDNVARVERGSDISNLAADRITTDSLPDIGFAGLDDFLVDGQLGNDVATFVTWNLIGATSTNYAFDGGETATLVIEGNDGSLGGDDNFVVTNPAGGPVEVSDNNGANVVVTATNPALGRLQINTLGGDDQVLVDVAAVGSDVIGVPITFNGGSGSDVLVVTGAPVTPIDEVIYTPGQAVTDGRLLYQDAAEVTLMTIDFSELEPVVEMVVALNLTVNGTGAANSFSYTEGSVATTGLVAVDGFETIEFNNKTNLLLNGNGGSDQFNINNPNTPDALGRIVVDGGDPTAGSDVAILNGTTGVDAINFLPTSDDDAIVLGAGPVPITLTTIESTLINGQGENDSLTYTSPTGEDGLTFTPGTNFTAGTITGVQNAPPNVPLMPLGFTNIGNGIINFADIGGARVDDLFVRGTDGDDIFDVTTAGGVRVRTTNDQLVTLPMTTLGVDQLVLQGLDGADRFDIAGDHPFTDDVNASLTVEGGNPDNGSDLLNFNGAGADIAVDLAARTVTETGFGAVAFSGIETVDIAAADAALTASLTPDDDELTYRPTGSEAGTFQNESDNTTFLFTAVAGTFTLSALESVADQVIVEGTNSHDQILIDAPNRTVTVTDAAATALKTITLADDVETITARARDGNDTILVVPAPTVGANVRGNLQINVDGGGPGASDALVIATAAGTTLPATDFVVNAVGLNPGEGRVRVFRNAIAMPDISYTNTEIVSPNTVVIGGVPQLLVLGPDASEPNEYRTNATFLGAGDTINVDNLALFPNAGEHPNVPADVDFFQLFAEETGTLDVTAFFETYDPALLPAGGQMGVNVLDSNGNVIAGAGTFGNPDASPNARVRFPAVQGQTYFVTVFGADPDGTVNTDVINGYELTITNEAPPIPYDLELLDNPPDGTTNPPGGSVNSDTGRSQFDNNTYDNTPTLVFRLDDGIFLNDLPGNGAAGSPPDEVIPIPFQPGIAQPVAPGFAIAIFDEGDSPPQTGQAPQDPLGFATAVPGQEGVYQFTVPNALALADGSRFLTARVQILDPANPLQTGWGERSLSLEIIVDTVPPPVQFGGPGTGLHPNSDSGDPIFPGTLTDRITNDVTPTFFGRAEANSIIRAYVDRTGDGFTADDLLIGQTVAIPLDGTNQAPSGEWEITSTVDMNDPALLAGLGLNRDGVRQIFVTAEDLAGNITDPVGDTIQIFIDTQGPQVTDVAITGIPGFSLFTLKPETPEPTPRVDSLTISIQDFPERALGFLLNNGAILNVPSPEDPLAPIVLVGDHSGPIAITGIAYNGDPIVAGQPATGEIVLQFGEPLPDDRYTLTLQDNLIDPAGNRLDGESNAAEPIGVPEFQNPAIGATGDEIPGGDFIARFTVDSRPEVATWAQGVVYVDINGNFVWDPEGEDNDAVNRDFVYNFGEVTDAYFAGNFAPTGAVTASGFDKIGAYGAFLGTYQFFLDTDDDGVGDFVGSMAYQVNAIPVAGDFNAAHPGDEIGAFDGEFWYLDTNGNNRIDLGERFATTLRGLPIVGDFNGDGSDDLATFNNATGLFQFDLDRNGTVDDTLTYDFSGFGEKPVAGDFNLDGLDDIGLYVPDQEGQLPKEAGEFQFLISDRIAALPSNAFDEFSPAPLGNDFIVQFGDDIALPLFGNFDPPIGEDEGGASFIGTLTNESNPLDTNVDGKVSALDALVVINALGRGEIDSGSNPLRVVSALNGFRLDASGDGSITALDALRVINGMQAAQSGGEAEGSVDSGSPALWARAVDSVTGELDDDDELLRLLAQDQELLRAEL